MLADWELRVLHRNSQVAIFLPIKFPLETSLLQYIPVTQLFKYENKYKTKKRVYFFKGCAEEPIFYCKKVPIHIYL